MDPPQTPLRPAIGVTATTASLQADSTAATSSVECGRTTMAGRWGTDPSAAQPMARGHQSRPASARLAPSVRTSAPLATRRSISPAGSGGVAPERRSVTASAAASIGVTGVGAITAGRARR